MDEDLLYYGDNLEILSRYIQDESVDLVYLDPPFKSDANYNMLFAEQDGARSAAQFRAFEDTWRWDEKTEETFIDLVARPETPHRVRESVHGLHNVLGRSAMMAYIVMMAPRLMELRRVLKRTGSIYLHCDPTASPYLRVVMDGVFGPENFRNEIIWKRTSAHSSAKRYGPVHDVIFYYTKSEDRIWHPQYQPYDAEYIETFFRNEEPDGRRWASGNLTGAGVRRGETGESWRGIDVTERGRHWAFPPRVLDEMDAAGRIYWPKMPGGMPRVKQYLEDSPGIPLQDVWTDIPPIGAHARERLGYPTQKPEALLTRIVKASSDEGSIVLDPFCGCGTTIVAAQHLKRRWVGIDLTHLAITLIKHRLADVFGDALHFETRGEPVDVAGALALAAADPFQFQWWALGLVGARPVDEKKGADSGIDGRLFFRDPPESKRLRQIVLSVKAGKPGVAQVRDLKGVMEREKADMGVLLLMQEPTQAMTAEAASAGFYESAGWNRTYPRLQIFTISQLLEGKGIDYPPSRYVNVTYKRAPRSSGNDAIREPELPLG